MPVAMTMTGRSGGLQAHREAGDDVRRVARLRGLRDLLDRRPARARVELRDRDEQERDGEADHGGAVQLAEAERAVVEGQRDRDEADRREQRGDDDGLVERVDDRVLAPADAGEERADHRREDRHAADGEREEVDLAGRELRPEEHHRDRRDGVGLEEVGGHARAVADVVADVVGDHCRVPRIVLGDAGLDLPDQVGADVRRLRVDPASESREHRDQRAAEREPHEVVDGRVGRVAHDLRQQQVVAGDAEQAETDDQQAGDGAGLERDVERRLEAVLGRSRGAHVRADGDVHADEARRRRETGADEEAEGAAPAELVVEAEQQERDDRDERDGRVLLLEVGRRALLHGARDLLHALVARRPAHQPQRQVDAVQRPRRTRR